VALLPRPILNKLALWQVADAAVHRPVLGLGVDIVSACDAGPAVSRRVHPPLRPRRPCGGSLGGPGARVRDYGEEARGGGETKRILLHSGDYS
jgi:hypothetical protein